jgi:biotin carboxylase
MSKKPTILIAGGGYADIPLIQAAKNLGFYVITTGNRPEELGHSYSDAYVPADYSSCKEMLGLAKARSVDALCPCCNDFSAISCAYVAEKLGLPGHDPFSISKLIHHKDRFRVFSIEHGFPVPEAVGISSVEEGLEALEQISLPVIIKPVDLTGGKGVEKVSDKATAAVVLNRALDRSRAHRAVVEAFIEGTRHALSILLVDGKVAFSFSDNEQYYLNDYLVSGASAPGRVPCAVLNELCRQAERYASLLNLKNGLFHMQYILRNGVAHIIEVCRRAPGDLYIRLVELATGVNCASAIVNAALGWSSKGLQQAEPRGFFMRHCVMADRNGILKEIVFDSSIEANVVESLMWGKPGDRVNDYLTAKFGIVFLRFDSAEEMRHREPQMPELIKTVVV